MQPADKELVRRYQQGDSEAFNEIYEQHTDLLLGFLTKMCGNYEDARDVVQDTLLAVFRNLNTFRGECSLKNWIYKIAVRQCSRLRHKRARESPLAEDPNPTHLPDGVRDGREGPPLFGGKTKREEDPERKAINGEIYRHIAEEVAAMPYPYRIVLVLKDFEGLPGREVSEIIGIRETTAKVRLHRARLSLRDRLQKRYASPQAQPKGSPQETRPM